MAAERESGATRPLTLHDLTDEQIAELREEFSLLESHSTGKDAGHLDWRHARVKRERRLVREAREAGADADDLRALHARLHAEAEAADAVLATGGGGDGVAEDFPDFLTRRVEEMNAARGACDGVGVGGTGHDEDLIELCRVFDKDRNGEISVVELSHVLTNCAAGLTLAQVDEFIREAGLDGERGVDYEHVLRRWGLINTESKS